MASLWPPLDLSNPGARFLHLVHNRWYIDNEFIAGVTGENLQSVSNTEIPSEPMYLLANVAVSKDWGMPDAYFLGCENKCWSCYMGDACDCALPKGYCDNFPAQMEIDYIRVYQAEHDPKHHLGCSPPTRPTKEWIEHPDHIDWFKSSPDQELPLKVVVVGGASCLSDDQCGNGVCLFPESTQEGFCQCPSDWTGPTCLAHAAVSNNRYHDNSHTPFTETGLLVVALIVVILAVLTKIGINNNRAPHKGDYKVVPDADASTMEESPDNSSHGSLESYQRADSSTLVV
jgi:Beta-glucan synthesis-associated protein SKN1/KRE6/Sbg1